MILPLLFAAHLAAGTALALQAPPARAPLLDHADLGVAMARLTAEHPDLVTIVPVGTSRGGRKIDALRIAAGELKPGRPAILLVANIDGPRVYTSGIALDHAQTLAGQYAKDAKVKALLDTTTLYVVPRANPDAAEARFEKPLREVRATGTGVDNDRDGRSGEDAPADIDEDGQIASMRVPDPDGEWIADPTDPRVLIKADKKKGERGQWKVFAEGRDSDKDEQASEDSELDAVVNRNFPEGWQEHDPEAGLFATDEPETRALCEFILAHKDVAMVVTYGALDNLVERPTSVKDDAPAVKRVPPPGVLESDADLLSEIGRRYRRITKSHAKGQKDAGGSFQAWCYTQRGLWSLELALWGIPLDEKKEKPAADAGAEGSAPKPQGEAAKPDAAPADPESTSARPDLAAAAPNAQGGGKGEKPDADKPTPSDDAKRLAWLDANGLGARFIPWHTFQHPEFGAVEIGGFAPYASIEPADAERAEIAGRELEFLTSLGELLARVEITECTAKDLFGGLWEIEAAIENRSFLPLRSKAGMRAQAARPARVTLRLPAGTELLAGDRQALVGELTGSGGRKEFRWLVRGAPPSSIEVEVDTDQAGTARATPKVQ